LISFIIKTQNVVRKMPQMGLENRGRAVSLVNSGTPKEKIPVVFFIILYYVYV